MHILLVLPFAAVAGLLAAEPTLRTDRGSAASGSPRSATSIGRAKKDCRPSNNRPSLRAILDKCVEVKLNAIIFQIRPMADALYKSDLEPS